MPENTYYYDRQREKEVIRKARRRRRRAISTIIIILVLALSAFLVVFVLGELPQKKVAMLYDVEIPAWIDSQIMPESGTSRRGEPLEDINSIVVHYVGNPGTSAQSNRNYYDNPGVEVNSHFVVGLDGEIIQCIPLYEKSSASNHRNRDTISIEVCHPDETGEFSEVMCDGIFVSIGRDPATKLFEGILALDENGYIIADESTKTNIDGVYAVGDVRTKTLRQVVTAVSDGATAAHFAEEYISNK